MSSHAGIEGSGTADVEAFCVRREDHPRNLLELSIDKCRSPICAPCFLSVTQNVPLYGQVELMKINKPAKPSETLSK